MFVVVLRRRLRALRDGQTVLLLNAACCDLAISLTGYPYSTLSAFCGGWFFGDVMCQLYGFLCFTLNEVQMNTLVVIAVFRYISICRPQFKYLLTPSLARRCLLVVWVYCLLFTVAPLLGWSRYTLEPSTVSCSTDWHDRTTAGIAYSLSLVIFCFLVQVAGLVICYSKIFTKSRRLYLRRPNLFPPDANDEYSANEAAEGCKYYLCLCEKSFKNRVEKHVLWVNLLMVLSFVTFWTPYALTSVVSIFRDDLGLFWYVFPTVFAKTSCMMNPLIYGLSHKLLYRELKVLLGSCCCCLCWCCGGGTRADSLTDLEDMRRRQAEGTYDKEGIYLGKVRVGVCTCNGCVMSRREMTILAQLHKTTTSTTTATTANNNYNSSINNLSHNTCSIALVEECPNPTPSAAATPETDRQTESSSVCYDSLDRDKALVTLPPSQPQTCPSPHCPLPSHSHRKTNKRQDFCGSY
ncbi:rhodopsin, G0-coupled-like isoform X2 [Scylla paramamosain]